MEVEYLLSDDNCCNLARLSASWTFLQVFCFCRIVLHCVILGVIAPHIHLVSFHKPVEYWNLHQYKVHVSAFTCTLDNLNIAMF